MSECMKEWGATLWSQVPGKLAPVRLHTAYSVQEWVPMADSCWNGTCSEMPKIVVRPSLAVALVRRPHGGQGCCWIRIVVELEHP